MMMKKIEMMEAKLWFAFCALLLVDMGSADEAANATTVQTPKLTKSGNSVTPLPPMSPAASNVFTGAPETGTNTTNTTGTFSTSAPHTTQSTTNHTTPLHDAPTSSTPSDHSTQNETVSAPNATTATATGTFPASASNATASQDTNTSLPSTNATQSSSATVKPSPVNTTALLAITSTHAESSPRHTMEGSNSHDSPRLDPLLVGLVSAFIIAAIVITLLLFLKFRRRQNGPQFHRLQDLPMDDMMEEAPLSMYSY